MLAMAAVASVKPKTITPMQVNQFHPPLENHPQFLEGVSYKEALPRKRMPIPKVKLPLVLLLLPQQQQHYLLHPAL